MDRRLRRRVLTTRDACEQMPRGTWQNTGTARETYASCRRSPQFLFEVVNPLLDVMNRSDPLNRRDACVVKGKSVVRVQRESISILKDPELPRQELHLVDASFLLVKFVDVIDLGNAKRNENRSGG